MELRISNYEQLAPFAQYKQSSVLLGFYLIFYQIKDRNFTNNKNRQQKIVSLEKLRMDKPHKVKTDGITSKFVPQ